MQIIVTQEEKDRRVLYALGKACGWEKDVNEFRMYVTANKPNGEFDGTYTIEIPDGQITEEEAVAIIANPEQPVVEPTYDELRKEAYLPIEEQLDMLYHDMENGTTNWRDHRRAVKQAYPKP
jgi:hypothetical protein